MRKLSAVIITFNEEENIGRCIDSVLQAADEILVVDSYSVDRTKEICLTKGVRFIENQWPGYSNQKNYANSLAAYDLILSLDADEALSDTLKDSIMGAKEDSSHDAWEMNRLTNYCGSWIRHCGWYPDRKLRLFDRNKARWDGARLHERITSDPGSRIGFLKGDILHYSYTSIRGHISQINLFTDINAQSLFEQGKRVRVYRLLYTIPVRFFRDYFLRLGMLDGYHGLVICCLSAWAAQVKYLKLRELHAKADKNRR